MSEFSKLNYINIGPNGTFRDSGDLHTTPADIDAIFDHLTATHATKLAVHFHGGLVGESKGERIARDMFPVYDGAGAHAVTFIWETGLVTSITRNLLRINETRLFQKLLGYVFRQITKRLGADISGRGSGEAMSVAEIEAEMAAGSFVSFDAAARGGAARITKGELRSMESRMRAELQLELQNDPEFHSADSVLLLDPNLTDEAQRDLAEGGGRGIAIGKLAVRLAKITFRVVRRFVNGRDHGVSPTVVEEILRELYIADFGGWVWGNMKDIAIEMWLPNGDELNEDSHPGRYFLDKLQAHQTARPDFKLDLIGHSAGSIAICEMLKAAEVAGNMPDIRNVFFLAPACRIDLMHDEIVDRDDRFDMFRMFTMSDATEQQDHLVPHVYVRSLLYFIAGVLEPDEVDIPIAGMERYWTQAAPFADGDAAKTAAWLKVAGANRIALSVTSTDVKGMQSASISHGGFDNDDHTRASLAFEVAKN